MKFPKFSQWKQLFKILDKKERTLFLIFVVLAILSAGYLVIDLYLSNTKIVPAYSGTYTEGVVGQPRFINPIYGETNDVDRTLIDLVYSGLMTYDKDGKIVNDLAKSHNLSDDGKTYTFLLKDNLYWQDGTPLTAGDVIYTIKTIQNSDYKSPLRANWLNVDIKKVSDKSLSLSLNAPYNSFLENCTLKIIPAHIWKNVSSENFALTSYNLQPVGSGPYTLSALQENKSGFIKSLTLVSNHKYYEKLPYISQINFNFFSSKEDLISAANQKTINGFDISALGDNQASLEKQIHQGWSTNEKYNVYSFSLPRYFAVFFNNGQGGTPSKLLSDSNITQALNDSVNKQELIQKIQDTYKEKISLVNSPLLPDYFGYAQPTVTYSFDTGAAGKLLDKAGYKLDAATGLRAKANTKKPAFQFKSYLKVGSSGNEVVELQGCLSRLDDSFKNPLQNETSGKFGKGTESAINAFQEKYLPDTQSTGETGPTTRKKLNELCLVPQNNSIPLQFTLTTINQPQLVMVANLLRDYWQKVGATVQVKTVELSELKDIIKNRNYDALLYGQALGMLPDLYPFWHSTQINAPGLNLSSYQNKKADQLLKDARETSDDSIKSQKYENLQNIILTDAPALFLYNPDYLYWVSGKVKGIDTTKIVDPAKRFENIINWFINTKRVWK
ncbi:MAG: ABC transporter substrate-binding protein [Candidatus Staskawiczbacteria bacterium]|nr:ABC transporter substrate-binding protein [Candidatus Staskawiczbacteria bacterium]